MSKNVFAYESGNLDLAYLLGMYLTDGCVKWTKSGQFRLKSIDKDIAENIAMIGYRLFGHMPIISFQKNGGTSKGNHYEVSIYSKDLCKWLEDSTDHKRYLPPFVYGESVEWRKEFLAGLLDGDGWCSVSFVRKKNNPTGNASWWASIGLCGMTDTYMNGMSKFFATMNIDFSHYDSITKAGTSMREYKLKTSSFVENNLYFRCKRKSDKLDIIKREKIGFRYNTQSLQGSTNRDLAPTFDVG